jgi:formylglycine-generating enzyme required for sulfatase activity
VPITAPTWANNYSIDATEVTTGQYDEWLATNPALPASTDANCSYVTSYAEQASGGTLFAGTDAAHHPVADVDWCDAYMYCKGVGKRLCGAIGGGTNAFASYADATLSQWYRACSSGGADTFPYGNTYQATYCDGGDYGANQTVAVGSLVNCVTSTTGFAGAYDLSGNVVEWEDSCSSTGPNAMCRVRGGAFNNNINGLNCGFVSNVERGGVYNGIGFRCCSP